MKQAMCIMEFGGEMVELQAVEVQDAAKEGSLAGVDGLAVLGQAAAATHAGAAVR